MLKEQLLLKKTFSAQLGENQRKSSIKWAAVNLCFLSVIFYDVNIESSESSRFFYVAECIACGILFLSFLTNILTYIYHSWCTEKIVCENEAQKVLLNLSNSIVKSPESKVQTPSTIQNETMTIRNLSYQNYSERKRVLYCYVIYLIE